MLLKLQLEWKPRTDQAYVNSERQHSGLAALSLVRTLGHVYAGLLHKSY